MNEDLVRVAGGDLETIKDGHKGSLGSALDLLDEVRERGDNRFDVAQDYRIAKRAAELYLTDKELEPFETKYNKLMEISR